MNYAQLTRRCHNAMQDAIERGDLGWQETMRGIVNALESGPFQPGEVVDCEYYRLRIDVLFGRSATVEACWLDEGTGQWFVAVRDENNLMAAASAKWFHKAIVPASRTFETGTEP